MKMVVVCSSLLQNLETIIVQVIKAGIILKPRVTGSPSYYNFMYLGL